MRLIDADALKIENVDLEHGCTVVDYAMAVIKSVADAPTIDAVPVVRCRYCRSHHWEQEERSKGCSACEMTTRGLTYKQIEYGALRGDFINDSGGMYIIRYEGGQHSIVCDDDGTEIDIEFCPMCGRRLEEV